MKIALVSLNQKWENKIENLKQCEKYIVEGSKKKVELIIFPEMTLTGFTNNLQIAEEYENSFTIKEFRRLAKENNIAIVFGMVIKSAQKGKNSLIVVDKNGEILDLYTKIHPFSFADEDKYFEAGRQIIKINFNNIKIGCSICYDLRFCNLYSVMDDCDIIINIANWPAKRIDHWNTLLKARAIENQTYIIGVNRVGVDGNNLQYVESSKIFNANGDELEYKKMYEEMKIYQINLNWNKKFKSEFNTIKDKKELKNVKR
jgi:omega-amidase